MAIIDALNREIQNIVHGTYTLARGAAFPAVYTLLGYSSKIESQLPSINWSEIAQTEFHFKPKMVIKFISDKLSQMEKEDTLGHAKNALYSIGRTIRSLNFSSAYQSMSCSLHDHIYEIQLAAVWGLSATFVNMVLKNIPGIKEAPKTRILFATVLGAGATWAAVEYGLEEHIDPQVFIDIAIKVGIIGSACKVANVAAQLTLKGIRGTSDNIAAAVRGTCNRVLDILNFLDWGAAIPKKEPEKEIDISKPDDFSKLSIDARNLQQSMSRRDEKEEESEESEDDSIPSIPIPPAPPREDKKTK